MFSKFILPAIAAILLGSASIASAGTVTPSVGVYFATDTANYTGTEMLTAVAVAQVLAEDPTLDAIVIGNADTRASEGYNFDLAGARATAVANDLVALGVSPDQLHVWWDGEDILPVPTANNVDEAGNRVVQIYIWRAVN